jgi:hypothetical protein
VSAVGMVRHHGKSVCRKKLELSAEEWQPGSLWRPMLLAGDGAQHCGSQVCVELPE